MTTMRNTQTREIKAAVVRKKGGPFQIETLALDEPRPDEVLIRIVATGMCHTDPASGLSASSKATASRISLSRVSSNSTHRDAFRSTSW